MKEEKEKNKVENRVKSSIKSRKELVMRFYIYCPICDKELVGNSVKTVEYNLMQHLKKHDKLDKISDKNNNSKKKNSKTKVKGGKK